MKNVYPYLPKTVRVGYKDYDIVVLSGVETMQQGVFGDHNNAKGEIRICPGLNAQEVANTLLHEILHAVWICFNIGCPLVGSKENQSISEERVVSGTANGLLSVIRDNPELFEFLAGCSKHENN